MLRGKLEQQLQHNDSGLESGKCAETYKKGILFQKNISGSGTLIWHEGKASLQLYTVSEVTYRCRPAELNVGKTKQESDTAQAGVGRY